MNYYIQHTHTKLLNLYTKNKAVSIKLIIQHTLSNESCVMAYQVIIVRFDNSIRLLLFINT